MTNDPHFVPDFLSLSMRAAKCAAQWRAWSVQHTADTYDSRRANELAALFDQQSRILHHMHHNRVTWQPITRSDLTKPTT